MQQPKDQGNTPALLQHPDVEGNTYNMLETRSRCSSSRDSRQSNLSSASAAATKACAKAEAARALASYAIRDADIIRKQACIEEEQQRVTAEAAVLAARRKAEVKAHLHVLKQEKAASATIAEAEFLEAAAEDENMESHRLIETQMTPLSTAQRISEYVQSHTTMYTAPSHHDPRSLEVHPAVVNVDTARCYKTEPVLRFDKLSGHEQRSTCQSFR